MAKRKLQRGAINPTSQKINEFIKANAHLYPTWQDVADAVFEKLGARLSMPAVARRGNTLKARPAGRHTRPVPQVVVEAGKDPLQEAIRLHILKRKGPHTVLTLAEWQQQTGLDMHSFVATPDVLFVDAGADNYQLAATSPALDTGETRADVPTDIVGVGRPQGAGFDVGAYERPVAQGDEIFADGFDP